MVMERDPLVSMARKPLQMRILQSSTPSQDYYLWLYVIFPVLPTLPVLRSPPSPLLTIHPDEETTHRTPAPTATARNSS